MSTGVLPRVTAARRAGRKRQRPPGLGWVVRVALGTLVLVVAIPLVTAFRVWWAARSDRHPHSDVIIVMGASQYDGRPSPVFQARLAHAKRLRALGVAPVIVTVGGNRPGDRFTEGGAGRRWLLRQGVPGNAVIKVEQGRDTLSSLRAVHQVLADHGLHTAVIVSDPWHSLRALLMADDVGIPAHTSPARTGPAVRTRDAEFGAIAHETGSYLRYVFLRRGSV